MSIHRVLLVISLFVSGLATMPTSAGASGSQGFVAERVAHPGASRRAWTPERMRSARPAPMPVIQPADLAAEKPSSGTPVVFKGSSPTADRYAAGSSEGSESWATRSPIPFTRSEVLDPSEASYAAHGMIFGTSAGNDFACSGTAITSDNRSVVWTAGHCLHYQGEMSSEVVFVPGYEKEVVGEEDAMEETAPYGVWPADLLMVPPRWERYENPLFDFGAIRVTPTAAGALGDVIPTRGIAFNQHPTETLQSFGYPALPTSKFDGEHLQTCVSQGTGRVWDGMMGMGCDMEEGSSGGGWIMRNEFVTSNVSGGNMRIWPNMSFGPYLGSAAETLYDAIRGGSTVYPQPTPSTPVTIPPKTHPMKITLNLRDHLTAKGRVTAADGFSGCVATAPVRLGKKRSDGVFYPVGKLLFTNPDGTFQTRLRDRKGSYFAIVEESTFDLSNRCEQAVAFDRHRH